MTSLELPAGGGEGSRPEPIRLVCATRLSPEAFFRDTPLGRSLQFYRTFPQLQRIELRLFSSNSTGLPSLYNTAIADAADSPAVLVFIHDDVHLSDFYWADRIHDGLRAFDIIGLAGNRRGVRAQPTWMHGNRAFEQDSFDNLSGVLGHGDGFPNLAQLSVYGPPGQRVALLDGVLLAARSKVLLDARVQFDPRFAFHFYDLDFCRQAEAAQLSMGTWGISLIHSSGGRLATAEWSAAYEAYLRKYGEVEEGAA